MFYKLYKKFYVIETHYKEFNKILFNIDELNFSVFCVSCGNVCGNKNLCYNKNCYRFIFDFSYNEKGKRIYIKDEIELKEENIENKMAIELSVGIKKDVNLEILNTEIELANLEYNEYVLMCYLKNNNRMFLDIDFDEILKFVPVIHTKYSSLKKF
jgi:hypothetical protein